MRVLHVAALPFPSPQGTQGLIASMLRSDATAGHETHLLCYPGGFGTAAAGVQIHRVSKRFAARTAASDLRSGPSLRKLVLDAALALALARCVRSIAPELVIAHHVEAAFCCAVALPRHSWLFCAHTSVEHELASYFPPAWSGASAVVGRYVDAIAASRAGAVVSVSPLLTRHLSRRLACAVHTLPLPWPSEPPASRAEQLEARRALGIDEHAHVVLYAGNLDAYQGLPLLFDAMERVCVREPRARLLVATASPHAELAARLLHFPALVTRTVVSGLAVEAQRKQVHAAATLAAVPRSVPGGVPIKLLDALARAVPVVATHTAAAGYDLARSCVLVPDGDALAFAEAILRAERGHGEGGPAWVAHHFAAAGYTRATAEFRAILEPTS